MPTKIKDAEGKEHEVFTQADIDAKVEEERTKAVEEAKKEFETSLSKKDKDLKSLQDELDSAKESLENASQGTKDWAEARKSIKILEGKVEILTKEKDELKDGFAKDIREVRTSTFKSTVDSWMDNLSGGDVEVKKKIQFHYERLGKEIKDESEAMEVIKDAHLLATGRQAPNMFNVARGFGGGIAKTKEPASQEVSELGKKFGISDEDITKYGAKAQEKKPGNQ